MAESILPGRRSSGVLLHPTSLPGPGIGDMGASAWRFVDSLAEAGQTFWQILPLVAVDSGGSPYNGLSAFAGNPLLIAPDRLHEAGLLGEAELLAFDSQPGGAIDFADVARRKRAMMESAHARFRQGAAPRLESDFAVFRSANAHWLPSYALFRALRDHFHAAPWSDWPAEIRWREPAAVERWGRDLAEDIELVTFQQFVFDRQWRALRDHANGRGVRIIGDLPIFVAHDSADVWSRPDLFQLDPSGLPTVVSGVPPDYFSATGQRWGNPLYRWDLLASRGYDWWVDRFRRVLELADLVRIDHFRGFESYWEIPAEEETAVRGRWVEGPGIEFFRELENRLGRLPVIAEDLGLITRAVEDLRDTLDFPGMRVLQFAFDGDATNPHLPANHPENSVAYTGTHDNDTTCGWWSRLAPEERTRVQEAVGTPSPSNWDFIRLVFGSAANIAIVPVQDLLGAGSEARMNTPGESAGNWTWRLSDLPSPGRMETLRGLTVDSGRAPDNLERGAVEPHLERS